MNRARATGIALAAALGCGPIGPFPGGPLTGDVVLEPVLDWSFTKDVRYAHVETRPVFPHSITTVIWGEGDRLYLPARGGGSKRWTHYVLEDPRVRVRLDGDVYLLRATRVMDPGEIELAAEGLAEKYGFPIPEDPREREKQLAGSDLWIFRLEAR